MQNIADATGEGTLRYAKTEHNMAVVRMVKITSVLNRCTELMQLTFSLAAVLRWRSSWIITHDWYIMKSSSKIAGKIIPYENAGPKLTKQLFTEKCTQKTKAIIKRALDNILNFKFFATFHLSSKYWLVIHKYKKKNSKIPSKSE